MDTFDDAAARVAADDVPPTVRFATLATARFIDTNFETMAGRPMLDAEELERDVETDSTFAVCGSFRPRFPNVIVAGAPRIAGKMHFKSRISIAGVGFRFDNLPLVTFLVAAFGAVAGKLNRPTLAFGKCGVTVNSVDESCDKLRVTFNFISNKVASTKCLA